MHNSITVLIVEDDENLAELASHHLEMEQYQTSIVNTATDALTCLQQQSFDVVLVDHVLPDFNGLQIITELAEISSPPSIIMVTGAGSEEVAVEAMKAGADDYIVKDVKLAYLNILPMLISRIVKHKQQEQELNKFREMAEIEKIRSVVLSNFISEASHQFRTPLAVIQSSAYIISRLIDHPKALNRIEKIQEQGDAILYLIEKMTILTELDTQIESDLSPVNLNSFVDEVVTLQQRKFSEKNIDLNYFTADETVIIQGHSKYLGIAIKELLDNAWKSTGRDGCVNIMINTKNEYAIIQIEDNGSGMTRETQNKAFERFYYPDPPHTNKGFGLGLPIVKEVIRLHDGAIKLVSELYKGTKVSMSLKL